MSKNSHIRANIKFHILILMIMSHPHFFQDCVMGGGLEFRKELRGKISSQYFAIRRPLKLFNFQKCNEKNRVKMHYGLQLRSGSDKCQKKLS